MFPKSLAIVDVETTGLSSSRDRIIDLAIIRVDDGEITDTLNTLINPDTYIPREIEILTGIHAGELESAPRFFDLQYKVETLLKDAVFVAHNARFDYSFLRAELLRLGQKFSAKQLCTARLFRALHPGGRHNLDTLIETFGITVDIRHRAYPDARALWDFLQITSTTIDESLLNPAIDHAMHRPSLPGHILPDLVDNLPESPGVYHFMGENGVSLYIGKSKDIKHRVLSHFSDSLTSSRELKLSQEVRHIEAIETPGELTALLLESTMIKSHQPLHNRLLRHAYKLTAVKARTVDGDYTRADIHTFYDMDPDEIPGVIGMFRSVKQAKTFLEQTAREHELCPKLLGLESGKGHCFWYGLGWCRGACAGIEPIARYNLRFLSAFQEKRFKAWPFPGPVLIREETNESGEAIIVDKWCVLGQTKWDQTSSDRPFEIPDSLLSRPDTQRHNPQARIPRPDSQYHNPEARLPRPDYSFDLDTYKILLRYILNRKNQKFIKPLHTGKKEKQVSPILFDHPSL